MVKGALEKRVKKPIEKESWAGIAKMHIESLDPNSLYKNYRLDKSLSPMGFKTLSGSAQSRREALRR